MQNQQNAGRTAPNGLQEFGRDRDRSLSLKKIRSNKIPHNRTGKIYKGVEGRK